jgi:ATP-binding cassette subfamily C exporter for protease/lipase
MYGDPSLIVLDEPNSNLDDVGEQALLAAIIDLRKRGKTIVVITHRTSIITATSKLLLLREGTLQMFGLTQQVLADLSKQRQSLKRGNEQTAQPVQQGVASPGGESAPAAS